MAGHSKWKKIKHKKAKTDAKRGKAFTKLIKEITVAARLGGGDPTGNPRLSLLMEKAKEINMPKENTIRAIKKGTGELPGVSYEEALYEGYGPHGIAIIIEALTDNKNRAVAELRHLFSSKGGNLAEPGSVNWMFEQLGVIRGTTSLSEDDLLEALLEHDIQNIVYEDNMCEIFTDSKSLMAIKAELEKLPITIESAEIEWVAKTPTKLSDDQADTVYSFLEELEDQDDVQNLYSNLA